MKGFKGLGKDFGLAYSGLFWPILAHSGLFWPILAYSGLSWRILTYSGPFWHILAYSSLFWPILGGNWWKPWWKLVETGGNSVSYTHLRAHET